MSSLWVYPGQGAQTPGLLHRLPACDVVRECLAEASEVLGEPVLALDTAQALQRTRAVQLCLLLAGVASSRLLMGQAPPPDYVAGLSIGAYPAAVTAGVLSLAAAVRLVSLRGELMQRAFPAGYGMTAIVGLDLTRVEALVGQAHTPGSPVYVANINADNQCVIAGAEAAMAWVAQQAKAAGAGLAKRLAVSVPSHCPLLEEAAAELDRAFSQQNLHAPTMGYLSGTRGRPLHTAAQLRDDLAFNLCRVVDWRATLENAFERGVRVHVELPPGAVLTGLAKKVFEGGTALAFDYARLDTLTTVLTQERQRDR